MKVSELTVKVKLALAFGALALMVMLVSVLSLAALGREHEAFVNFVGKDTARVKLANNVLDAANARAIGARNLALSQGDAAMESERLAVVAAHEKLQADYASLKAMVVSDTAADTQELRLIEALGAIEQRYGPLALAIVDLALKGRRDDAVAKMNAECRPLLAALVKAAADYVAYAEQMGAEHIRHAESSYATNRLLLLVASVLAVLAAVGLAFFIARSLARQLGAEPAELGSVAARVAQGDLGPVQGAAEAPQGSVLASLGAMQQSLSRVVGQVRAASDSIATGSSQIASGTVDLSQRTEEQASNLQQTAASMEQLSAAVKNSASTAQQAKQLAGAASAVAQRGGEVMGGVVQTMEDISASSQRIADIIGVIDGIAFQTNILALNAAVEAARAGEQGRGFAVVASEVRSLAQRSAEAAKEIKQLIGASVEKVDAGSRLVRDAGSTMNDIVEQVRRVSDLIGGISTAAAEQTTGIGEVNGAMSNLDQATQQNAALVEQSAAASDALKHQAVQLAELVSVFRLGSHPAAAAA
jgi:methyl-accepting chemotaxis protein